MNEEHQQKMFGHKTETNQNIERINVVAVRAICQPTQSQKIMLAGHQGNNICGLGIILDCLLLLDAQVAVMAMEGTGLLPC